MLSSMPVCRGHACPRDPGKFAARILEFTRVLFGPALDHHFLFRIELYRIPPLPVLHAKEAVLPAAEREISHWCSHTDIDTDIPCRSFISELPRCRTAGGKQRSLIPVSTLLKKHQPLIQILGMHQAEHRPKDLRIRECAC